MKNRLTLALLIVIAAALNVFAQERENLQRGFAADKVYQTTDIDQVNLFNGNLSLSLPIGGNFSVDGALTYHFVLAYNSKVWDYHKAVEASNTHPAYYQSLPDRNSNAGLGWMLSLGRLITKDPEGAENPPPDAFPYLVWVAPDGSPHQFGPVFKGGDVRQTGYYYTTDGTYLRLHQSDSVHIRIEFPDGTIQEFVQSGGIWRLVQIHDHVVDSQGNSVNWVDINYDLPDPFPSQCSGDPTIWTFFDKHNRRSYVCFKNSTYPSDTYQGQVIDKIVLAGFRKLGDADAPAAVYQFGYTPGTIKYGCGDNYPGHDAPNDTITLPFLTSLTLPDGTSYGMSYAGTNNCMNGGIETLRLPTMGKIQYTYQSYRIPADANCQATVTWAEESPGIGTRKFMGAADEDLGTWTYQTALTPTTLGRKVCDPDTIPQKLGWTPFEEMQNTVIDPRGNRTVHYFSVWLDENHLASPNGFKPGEFGKPFTHFYTDTSGQGAYPTRYLTSRTYAAGSDTPLHSEYVVFTQDRGVVCPTVDQCHYELCDTNGCTNSSNFTLPNVSFTDECKDNHPCLGGGGNPRIISTSSVYHDDGNSVTYSDLSHYDGAGHYRQVTKGGSFGGTTRTAFQNFNPALGDLDFSAPGVIDMNYTGIAPQDPWILNTYSDVTISETRAGGGSPPMKSLHCFNRDTGFMTRVRQLAGSAPGPNDLFSVFTEDANGNASDERYFGGEFAPLSDTSTDVCHAFSSGLPAETYRVSHTFQYGMLAKSAYLDASGNEPFRSVDNFDIDAGTGLTRQSRDASMLTTAYEYDLLGRVTYVKPDSGGWARYTYNPASSGVLATVDIDIQNHGGSETVRQSHVLYDALGRVWREQQLVPDGRNVPILSQRETLYDRMLKASVSEMQSLSDFSAGNVSRTIFDSYDAFGRPLSITPPSGKKHRTTYQYSGIQTTTKTVGNADTTVAEIGGIAGSDASGNQVEKPSTTVHKFDVFGRVLSVDEPSGPNDAMVTTSYGYDTADHLTSVRMAVEDAIQSRTFTYDGRGLITSAADPESGTTNYSSYDARGHLRTRAIPGFSTLSFEFDRAERPTSSTQTGVGILDEVKYDRPNTTGDYSLGKIDYAIRHNYQPALGGDVPVKETYFYGGTGGRISRKVTTVGSGPEFTQSYTYDDLGERLTIAYPTCTGCPGLAAPSRTVTNTYNKGFLTRVAPYTSANSDIEYHPNGLLRRIPHANADGTDGPVYSVQLDDTHSRIAQISVFDYCDTFLITTQPQNQNTIGGSQATLTVAAPGAASYKWYQGISGDTSTPLAESGSTLTVSPSVTTSYWVRVGNGTCTIDSRTAVISVTSCAGLTIHTQPANGSVPYNRTVHLSVAVDAPAGATVTYQWYEGISGDTDRPVTGATNASYDTPPLTQSTSYWLRARSNSCAIDSQTAFIHVCPELLITVQPVSSMKPIPTTGTTALTASLQSTADIDVVDWYEVVTDASGHVTTPFIMSAAQLSVDFSSTSAPRTFFGRAKNTCGDTKDSSQFTLSVGQCVTIITNPQNATVYQGANGFPMSVLVEGWNDPVQAPKFHYYWHHGINGQDISLTDTNPSYWDKPEVTGSLTTLYDAWWCVIRKDGCPGEVQTEKAYVIFAGACPLPPLVVNPTSVTVAAGTNTTFTATVDWPSVTYQWYRGQSGDTSSPVLNETHNALTVGSAVATYWVRVTDECGVNHEDSQTLAVAQANCAPTVVTTQPQSVDVGSGEPTTLHVFATGGGSGGLTYTWYAVGVTGSQGTGTSLTVTPPATTSYYVQIDNSCTHTASYSLVATVHLKHCASITVASQPANAIVRSDSTAGADLSISAVSSEGALSYQWYIGETGDTSHPIANAISSGIHVSPAATTSYWVRVGVTGGCQIDSNTAVVTYCTPPQFVGTVQPVTNDISYGQSIMLFASAQGTDLHYEWHADSPTSNLIVGTEARVYVHPAQTTVYYCVVHGLCDSITTPAITVRVCRTPSIDALTPSGYVFSGKTVTLSVTAGELNNVPLTYLWQEVSGPSLGTTASVTTPPITTPKQYQVHVAAGACSIDSSVVSINVCTLPEIINTGTTQNAAVGQSVTLSCIFSGGGTNVYTWYAGTPGDYTHSGQISYNSSTTLTFTTSQTGTFTYWASIQNTDDGCISHTNAYTVNVCIPTIVTQPAGGGYDLVHPVPLSISANAATSYQWYTGATGNTTNPVTGATTASITVTPTADTSYWCRVTGSCGTVDSNSVLVTRCVPAAIGTQPAGGSITRGQSLGIGVGATGTNLSYQWYQGTSGNTTNPVYGNTPGITVNPINPTDYWVKVTGLCGAAVNSNTAHVSVCTTPVINTQPIGANVFSGQTVTLTVAASEAAGEALHYQWYTSAGSPVGSDSPTFTTPPVTGTTQYYVHVTAGICSVDSSMATVGLCTLPQVINTGTTSNVAIGQTVTLSCVISPGTGNTFTWYYGPVGDVAHSTQVSANSSSTYSFTAAATSGGTYWASVSRSDDGCVSRTNAYTVNVCIPTITTQPAASTMINSGQQLTLTVAANTSGLTYQWYVGTSGTTTTPIANATGASVTVSPASNTNYWVKVTGTCGQSVNSNTAAVTICVPPSITAQPAPNSYIVRGANVNLAVTAAGNGLTYQWYQGTSGNTSTPLAATTPGLTIAPINPIDYWVKVTGTCGSVNSNTAHVSVCTTPVINTQPASTSTFSGSSATLTVSASEATGETLHYQWYKNSSTPVGTDSATLNTGALTADTTFYVHITASSGTCAVDSSTATVSMCPLPQSVTGAPNQNTTPGQTVRLQLGSMPGATAYMWYAGTSGNTSAPVTSWQAANYIDVNPSTTSSWWAQVQNGSCVSNSTTTTVNVCIPTITTQPQNVTVSAGPTTLTVASNLSGSTYQWYVGTSGTTTTPITGATSASVSVNPSSTTSYWCKVSGSCGTANSNTATVTICSVPNITTQPVNASPVYRNSSSGLSVAATGTNLTYQWYVGASGDTSHPVSGATGTSYIGTAYNSEKYWVRVTGMCGTRDSNAAWISVIPQFIGQPVQTTYLSSGSRVMLSVNVYTNAYLHYAWCYDANGQTVPGSPDSAVWITPDITASNTYFCRVTSGIAAAESYRASVYLCDGGMSAGAPYSQNAGGSCRYLWSQAGGNYDHIEWYQGQKGDVSYQIGTGYYVYTCSNVGTSVWYRVVGYDSNQGQSCYTDSSAFTVP